MGICDDISLGGKYVSSYKTLKYEKEVLGKKILDSLAAINASVRQYGCSIAESQRYIRNQLNECNRNVNQIVVNTYGF